MEKIIVYAPGTPVKINNTKFKGSIVEAIVAHEKRQIFYKVGYWHENNYCTISLEEYEIKVGKHEEIEIGFNGSKN